MWLLAVEAKSWAHCRLVEARALAGLPPPNSPSEASEAVGEATQPGTASPPVEAQLCSHPVFPTRARGAEGDAGGAAEAAGVLADSVRACRLSDNGRASAATATAAFNEENSRRP